MVQVASVEHRHDLSAPESSTGAEGIAEPWRVCCLPACHSQNPTTVSVQGGLPYHLGPGLYLFFQALCFPDEDTEPRRLTCPGVRQLMSTGPESKLQTPRKRGSSVLPVGPPLFSGQWRLWATAVKHTNKKFNKQTNLRNTREIISSAEFEKAILKCIGVKSFSQQVFTHKGGMT